MTIFEFAVLTLSWLLTMVMFATIAFGVYYQATHPGFHMPRPFALPEGHWLRAVPKADPRHGPTDSEINMGALQGVGVLYGYEPGRRKSV